MNMPEEERIKELKLLKSSYEMYEKSKKDTETRMKQKMNPDGSPFYTKDQIKEKLDLIQGMEDDVIGQYRELGGNMDDLTKKRTPKAKAQKTVMDIVNTQPEVKPQPAEPVSRPAVVESVSRPASAVTFSAQLRPRATLSTRLSLERFLYFLTRVS